jgi:hypothetical protein
LDVVSISFIRDLVPALTDEEGELERSISSRFWRAPRRLEIDRGHLVWYARPSERVSAAPGMLEQFVALSDASAEQIAAYARRWGVLGLCEPHHRPMTGLTGPFHAKSRSHANCGSMSVNREPITAWRRLAKPMRSVMLLAAAGDDPDELRRPENWRGLGRRHLDALRAEPALAARDVRIFVRTIVGRLLVAADVRITLDHWGGAGLAIGGYGVLGALALELAIVVTGTRGFAMCSSCGRPYVPSRRPAAGRRRYCPECRAGHQDRRDAQSAQRRRRRGSARHGQ